MKIFTIGFTKKSAAVFFDLIKSADIKTLLDVRLNNVSQLAGFAKKNDLKFFLNELCDSDYIHVPEFAPTKTLLDQYKKNEISWEKYENEFLDLLHQRSIEKHLDIKILDKSCLLCSEHEPHMCHRKLVAEYLNENLNVELNIKHLF